MKLTNAIPASRICFLTNFVSIFFQLNTTANYASATAPPVNKYTAATASTYTAATASTYAAATANMYTARAHEDEKLVTRTAESPAER